MLVVELHCTCHVLVPLGVQVLARESASVATSASVAVAVLHNFSTWTYALLLGTFKLLFSTLSLLYTMIFYYLLLHVQVDNNILAVNSSRDQFHQ